VRGRAVGGLVCRCRGGCCGSAGRRTISFRRVDPCRLVRCNCRGRAIDVRDKQWSSGMNSHKSCSVEVDIVPILSPYL
jgi:hypothetical protein